MKIGETKLEILILCIGLCVKNYKTYCYPSRGKILILLKSHFNKVITLSCLDQHLSELNRHKYLYSYPRKGQLPDGTWYNKTSNRQLTKKAAWFLVKHGYKIAKWFMTWLKDGVLPKALRKSYNLSKLNEAAAEKTGKSFEDLHAWLKTPSLIFEPPT